jgi:DNA-binding NarL/FixJ family response regulator
MPCVSILVANRQPVVLCGLKAILCAKKGFNVVASHCDGGGCLQAMRDLSPDIALLGMFMPGLTGLEILAAATSERLCTRVVLFTADGDRELVTAVASGAHGVVSMDAMPEKLVHFLREVAAGKLLPLAPLEAKPRHERQRSMQMTLTERERQIMELVPGGLSNKEIGRRLSLAEGTIKVHLHRIYRKLALNNRTALAVSAWRALE